MSVQLSSYAASLAGLVPVSISGLTFHSTTIALCPRPNTGHHDDGPRTCRHGEVRLALGALESLSASHARLNGIFFTAMDGPLARSIVTVLQTIPDTLVRVHACCTRPIPYAQVVDSTSVLARAWHASARWSHEERRILMRVIVALLGSTTHRHVFIVCDALMSTHALELMAVSLRNCALQ
jgi:hypothetical protein